MASASTAVTLGLGESIPFFGCSDRMDLELMAVPSARFGFFRCNCRTRANWLNPHLNGSHLECVAHILPFDFVDKALLGAEEQPQKQVAGHIAAETSSETADILDIASPQPNFATLVLGQVLSEFSTEQSLHQTHAGAGLRHNELPGLFLRIRDFEKTKVGVAIEDVDAVENPALAQDQNAQGTDPATSLPTARVVSFRTSSSEKSETYRYIFTPDEKDLFGPDGELKPERTEPLIKETHLREAIFGGPGVSDGTEINKSQTDALENAVCVCIDVCDKEVLTDDNTLSNFVEAGDGEPEASGEGEDAAVKNTEILKQHQHRLRTTHWAYLTNDACEFLRNTFPQMRVLLINQVSVERETSGGGMMNHRLLFGLDRENDLSEADVRKILPNSLLASKNGEGGDHDGGGCKADVLSNTPPFLIGEGFSFKNFDVNVGGAGSSASLVAVSFEPYQEPDLSCTTETPKRMPMQYLQRDVLAVKRCEVRELRANKPEISFLPSVAGAARTAPCGRHG
ncbi:unnamed protein product [Amoebophrya sp. A120]|nr:unnamed protein product [Amoebophrya sp. A120]|eukprot:GSA120T00020028001.1